MFHEAIHAYNDKTKYVDDYSFKTLFKNERIAYAAEFMVGRSYRLRDVELRIAKLGTGVGRDDNTIEELRRAWKSAWGSINGIIGDEGMVTSILKDKPKSELNPSGYWPFDITEAYVKEVETQLHFKLSCREIAAAYNNALENQGFLCIQLICEPASSYHDKQGVGVDLHGVFK